MTLGVKGVGAFALFAVAFCGFARAESSVSLSVTAAGPTQVPSGSTVTVEVRATFDRRLNAAAFRVQASGSANAILLTRSANPTAGNGLTYVSTTSQSPFDDNLPVALNSSSSLEVLFDSEFDGNPAGATDGLPVGTNVLIETLSVRLVGSGDVTISLSEFTATNSAGPAQGAVFDVIDIGVPMLTYSVTAPCGDGDDDGDVDLIDWSVLQDCLTDDGVALVSPECARVDCDNDNDVDLDDYTLFQQVIGG